ncbi:MAG: diphthamide synthesis protein [Conexivisphaera sp.]
MSDRVEVLVDLDAVDEVLRRVRPRRAGVAAPDGMQLAARALHDHLRRAGVEPTIILDPTYGFCDLQDRQAEDLGLDVVFNLGHWSPMPQRGRTVLVGAEYILPEDRLARIAGLLAAEASARGWRRVGLFTTSNYGRARRSLARALGDLGLEVLPEGDDALGTTLSWQVTGCMFRGPWAYSSSVDGMAFLGSSKFHAVALRLATGRPTIMVNPESVSAEDVEEEASRRARRAALAVYRAAEARVFGVLTGERSGQRYPELARALGRSLERLGRTVYYYSAYEVSAERLGVARYVDAFVVLACPRIGLDMEGFDRPVLSYPQALQLLRVLRGESLNMEGMLRMPLWAWVGYERQAQEG